MRGRGGLPSGPVVGRVDQRLGLFGGEEGDGAWLEAFGWDREHPPDRGGVLGMPEQRRTVEQGSDRGQAEVPGPGAVAALGLEVLEERGDQRRVEVVRVQRRRCLPVCVLRRSAAAA